MQELGIFACSGSNGLRDLERGSLRQLAAISLVAAITSTGRPATADTPVWSPGDLSVATRTDTDDTRPPTYEPSTTDVPSDEPEGGSGAVPPVPTVPETRKSSRGTRAKPRLASPVPRPRLTSASLLDEARSSCGDAGRRDGGGCAYRSTVSAEADVPALAGSLRVTGGKLAAGEDFAEIRRACGAPARTSCRNPIAAAQSISLPTTPGASWGGRAEYRPGGGWYARGGGYLNASELPGNTDAGTDVGLPSDVGPLVMGEVGYDAGASARGTGGPATYRIGGYWDNEILADLSTGSKERGTWGVYAMGERQIYRDPYASDDGLWGWLSLSYAPPDVNPIEFMAAGGLGYGGILGDYDTDMLSITVSHDVYSSSMPDRGSRTMLSLDYRLQLSPRMSLRPDFQYVLDPDGRSTLDDALVVGLVAGLAM